MLNDESNQFFIIISMLFQYYAYAELLNGKVVGVSDGDTITVLDSAKTLFLSKAAGSIVYQGDQAIGSELIGQNFTDAKFFWGRPSATRPQPYNATASSGSNQGPLIQP